jgi:hypothetical protein
MRQIVKYTWSQNIRVALLLVISLFWLAVPALAQERAQVYILPPSEAPVTGQPVTVDVIAEDVSNLYGAEIHLSFDPTMVRLEDADPQQDGVQITPGSLLAPDQGFVVANTSDNAAGTAVFAITLVNPAPPVDGGGVVARLTFVPLQPGTLRFELENVKLVTRDLQTLDVSLKGLEVQGDGQAVAPANAVEPVGDSVPSATPIRNATPATGVPIWMLVLVALAVVSIPLVGAWFIFVREANQHPRPNNTP